VLGLVLLGVAAGLAQTRENQVQVAMTGTMAMAVLAAPGRDERGKAALIPVDLRDAIVEADNPALLADVNQLAELNRSTPHYRPSMPERVIRMVRAAGLLGTHELGGLPFAIDGVIQLAGAAWEPFHETEKLTPLRDQVATRVPSGRYATVHLLGAAEWAYYAFERWTAPGTDVAEVRWIYADGSSETLPLRYGVHLRELINGRSEAAPKVTAPHCGLAWSAINPLAEAERLSLYRMSLANPHPDRLLAGLEFHSARSTARLVLFGVTVDAEPLGTRPIAAVAIPGDRPRKRDKGFTAEVLDDATGQPVPGALVRIHAYTIGGGPLLAAFHIHEALTDREGKVNAPSSPNSTQLGMPAFDHRSIVVFVRKGGYAAQGVHLEAEPWNFRGPPDRHTFRLAKGSSWSSVVQDQDGRPVAGARVILSPPPRWLDCFYSEQSPFPVVEVVTDENGHWHWDSVDPVLGKTGPRHRPASSLGFEVRMQVHHPAFLDAPAMQVAKAVPGVTSGLFAGRHVVTLKRGQRVAGTVLDAQRQPCPLAKLWLGSPGQPRLRETLTGPEGRFDLGIVSPATRWSVSATAPNHRASETTLEAGQDWSGLSVELKLGELLCGKVVDVNGGPLSEVELVACSTTPERRWLWRGRTGAGGEFAWAESPDTPILLAAIKDPCLRWVGAVGLQDRQGLLITLKPGQRIDLKVLDANTSQPVTCFNADLLPSMDAVAPLPWDGTVVKGPRFAGRDGRLELITSTIMDAAVLVEAPEYQSERVSLAGASSASGTVLTVTVRLPRSPEVVGTVRLPDGRPADQATACLALYSAYRGVPMEAASTDVNLVFGHNRPPAQRVGSDGRFALPRYRGVERVVAEHEAGYGEASLDEVASSGCLQLEPWGGIEGVLRIDGQPLPGQGLRLLPWDYQRSPALPTKAGATDAQGRFAFGRLAPGFYVLVWTVGAVARSSGSWSHGLVIEVCAGVVTRVELGKTDRVVRGRFVCRWENLILEELRSKILLEPVTPWPQEKAGPQGDHERPSNPPEGAYRYPHCKAYQLSLQPGGWFAAEGIEPGRYRLVAEFSEPAPERNPLQQPAAFACAEREVAIPDADPQRAGEPVDLGAIELQPVPSEP
jgi:hypothetical protein